ncbi:Single-stranded-DNA-specific exonuclease recJ [Waddlia chondrophila 2032/99]|uniref:Single-stranded-DNA-specific exonuclease RecJ n=2 Tax=Waddlia chondrophila TaxID=71667 RepID=D6YSI0_WADCW|nr:single-stranded-DNA-specific exonuclease RecJ [Waddlia chondrophila]ADI39025.1 single-stranded-DNA-specific exonuclease RecJ [Waddlia chondrophila WSU 86-1044]CCB92143.1 Single-stranded-DNA-specific exonuclease recJ [Waddlia chondrophila 2032/99]
MISWNFEPDNPMWVYPKMDKRWQDDIIKEFKIHPVTAQLFVSRDFTTVDQIHQYLYAKLPDLHDPSLLQGMDKAVERIVKAIENEENILIYGDNDVDGMTGTALLTDYLRKVGANVYFYISTPGTLRQNLIIEAIEFATKNQCKLLITVDCGVTAATEIAKVVEKGIDVIITDHHEPTDQIPHCIATLNPKLLNNSYPNRDLTGVGVTFKLVHALTNYLVKQGKIDSKKIDLKRYLDLVALGTVADMGQLLGENRILVRYGLEQLKRTKRIGLAKLISVCDMEPKQVSTFTIASKIAPRLNSLGRIADPVKGVELLLIRNAKQAETMAQELDLNNLERQRIEKTMTADVDQIISLHPDILQKKAVVIHSDKWHPGVIAILCTRISKHYNRPTVMIAIENGIGKGSLRSIHEFPLLSVLRDCSDLLVNYGGHDYAAGLTIKEENIPEFKRRFIEAANRKLSTHDVVTKLNLDSEVQFSDLTFDLMESVKLLEPFGNENPQPLMYTRAKQAWPPKIVGKTHLKLYLEQGDRMLEGIAYGKAHLSPLLRKKNIILEVAFTPQVNNFLGPSIQLLIRDFRIIEESQPNIPN